MDCSLFTNMGKTDKGDRETRPPQCENHSWDFRVYYVNGRWGIPSLLRPFGLRHGPRQTKLPSSKQILILDTSAAWSEWFNSGRTLCLRVPGHVRRR